MGVRLMDIFRETGAKYINSPLTNYFQYLLDAPPCSPNQGGR